jgi:putative sterol carrier protein
MSSDVQAAVEALPSGFLAEKAGTLKALAQLDLTGENSGQWVLDVADGRCQVREEAASQPDVTLTMDGDDFVALFNSQLDPVQAFMAGKITVKGNLGLVMQLLGSFKRG